MQEIELIVQLNFHIKTKGRPGENYFLFKRIEHFIENLFKRTSMKIGKKSSIGNYSDLNFFLIHFSFKLSK